MATRTIQRTSFNPALALREYLSLKGEAAKISTRADTQKKRLKDWLPGATAAYKNENGSIFVDLDDTVVVDGVSYSGMELRRSLSVTFNEAKAEKILTAKVDTDKDILKDAQSSYIDQDKVHRLVAEGRISEKDLDKMFETAERFAFWPVKGEVI